VLDPRYVHLAIRANIRYRAELAQIVSLVITQLKDYFVSSVRLVHIQLLVHRLA
jgi:hypothetical protein